MEISLRELLKIGRYVVGEPIYNLVKITCVSSSGLCVTFVFMVTCFFGLRIPNMEALPDF
jgi:hypothetical protein